MPDDEKSKTSLSSRLSAILMGLPWTDLIVNLYGFGREIIQGVINTDFYEVLDYESTLELHNRAGTLATFSKRKKIRYLQNNIIAYQDYAWGDGDILRNYRTNLGKPVDRYRAGFKTFILLSLREVRNRGDIDEFNIQWDIRRGFLTEDGYWSTDISQRTRCTKIKVIFPKNRPPLRLFLEESNRHRTQILGREAQQQLPDGRWLVYWETNNPRLYEVYVLRWIW